MMGEVEEGRKSVGWDELWRFSIFVGKQKPTSRL